MTLPKISIIIPSFNQGKYIEQTITSIIDQQYSLLELIIIDGGSQDNTVDILKKYNDYLTYWVSEPDNGQAHAINKGLKIAKGDIINWINSDDYLEPDTLNKIGIYFKNNKNLNAIIGRIRYFDESGELFITNRFNSYQLPEAITCFEMAQPAMFFKRECFETVGKLNEQLHYSFDFEWWVRFLLTYTKRQTLEVDDLFANFRHHINSKSISAGYDSKFREDHYKVFLAICQRYRFLEEEKFFKSKVINSKFSIVLNSPFSRHEIRKVLQDFLSNEFIDIYFNKRDHYKALFVYRLLNRKYVNTDKWNKIHSSLNMYQKLMPPKLYKFLKEIKSGIR